MSNLHTRKTKLNKILTKPTLYLAIALAATLSFVTNVQHNLLNADTSTPIIQWFEYQKHGWGYLDSYMFTQDNWLFSSTAIYFVLFTIFGPSPAIPEIFGWFVFFLSCLAAGKLTARISNTHYGLVATLFLLFSSKNAHILGSASDPVTHNISCLFGLVALLLVSSAESKTTVPRYLTAYLLLLAGTLADPWTLAAFVVPIVSAQLLIAVLRKSRGETFRAAKFFVAGISIAVFSKGSQIGLLTFFPPSNFTLGTNETFITNAGWLSRNLTGIYTYGTFEAWRLFLVFLALVATVGLASWWRKKSSMPPNGDLNLIQISSIISIMVIFLAYLTTNVPPHEGSARFIINFIYLVVILVLSFAAQVRNSSNRKFLAGIISTVTLIAIVASSNELLLNQTPQKDSAKEILRELQEQNLSYGFGPYWGSNTHAVTALSGGAVTIRPITFDLSSGRPIWGNRPQSMSDWYFDKFQPKVKKTFVIVASDGEECPELTKCVNGLKQQFGEADYITKIDDKMLLVWNKELDFFSDLEIVAKPGIPINFGLGLTEPNGPDWWPTEAWGVWGAGHTSSLVIKSSFTASRLEISAGAFLGKNQISREIYVYVNGQSAGRLKVSNSGSPQSSLFRVNQLQSSGQYEITFKTEELYSPRTFGLSSDSRPLGVALQSITLFE